MIYFDYSATTKISERSLEIVEKDFYTKITENDLFSYKKRIKKILKTNSEIIITSGSTESNNLVLNGIKDIPNKKVIVTTYQEHSSINSIVDQLAKEEYRIEYISTENGELDIKQLESVVSKNNVALISVTAVNSETGLINPIERISEIADSKGIIFHCDATQGIGKINIPFDKIDLISISSHKLFGPKGIGLLIKKQKINIENIIKGKRKYNLGLLNGMIYALENAMNSQSIYENDVKKIRDRFIESIKNNKNIVINEGKNNAPHIINISVLNYKPETFLHYLEMNDIYISTKSACSNGDYSKAVYDLTKDMKRAETSVRISISHKTTIKEIEKLIEVINRSKHAR